MIDFTNNSELIALEQTADAAFKTGTNNVISIKTTTDRKVEFVTFDDDRTLALVKSAIGYPAYYPVHNTKIGKPLKAVLMDLDGTTVQSEHFWIWIIEKTIASLLGNSKFKLESEDEPYVSGNSVFEHLQYCICKYCPDKSLEEARHWHFKHKSYEINEIMAGRGKKGVFTPTPGIKEFLCELKAMGLEIGLVTSSPYEKAEMEIANVFQTLGMGDPRNFYDAIITAGCVPQTGEFGTLGELLAKPHPWLYAEAAHVGLGMPFNERHCVVGIEDSGSGIVSLVLAGFAPIGIGGGNIVKSGTKSFCVHYEDDFERIFKHIKNRM